MLWTIALLLLLLWGAGLASSVTMGGFVHLLLVAAVVVIVVRVIQGRRVVTWCLRAIAAATVGLLMPAAISVAAPDRQQLAGERRTGEPVRRPPTAATPARQEGTPAQPGATDYAAREAAAKGLERFEGGGVGIYIGGSTVRVF